MLMTYRTAPCLRYFGLMNQAHVRRCLPLSNTFLVIIIRRIGGAIGTVHFTVLPWGITRLFFEFADEVWCIQVTDTRDDIF